MINTEKPTAKFSSQDKTEIQKTESLILSSETCQTYFQQKTPRDKKLLKVLYWSFKRCHFTGPGKFFFDKLVRKTLASFSWPCTAYEYITLAFRKSKTICLGLFAHDFAQIYTKNFKNLLKPLYSSYSKCVERNGANMSESFSIMYLNIMAKTDIFCTHKIFYKEKENLSILFVFRLIRLQVH